MSGWRGVTRFRYDTRPVIDGSANLFQDVCLCRRAGQVSSASLEISMFGIPGEA